MGQADAVVPRLICLIGAECTGKTTLARALAAHLDCPFVPEYLREFCQTHQRTPYRCEQRQIMQTQHSHVLAVQARAARHARPFVFCDTAPLLTAVYSDLVFGDTSLDDDARTLHSVYALTLLLLPTIAWVADGLMRDGDHVRAPVTQRLLSALSDMRLPYTSITEHGDDRTAAALAAIDRMIRHQPSGWQGAKPPESRHGQLAGIHWMDGACP